jgi:lysophospholipase L1-like esterase
MADSTVYKIACLGDSITYGHGVAQTRTRDAWPFVLQSLLGEGFEVRNFGINGATALEDTPDSYRGSGFLAKALEYKADTYILMLGSNDTKARYWNAEAFRRDLRGIARDILGTGPEKLFLMLPPKAFSGPDGQTAYDVNNGTIRTEVIPAVLETAEEFGLRTIDLYSLTEDHPEYYLEGVHPNVLGNRVIAECVYNRVKL